MTPLPPPTAQRLATTPAELFASLHANGDLPAWSLLLESSQLSAQGRFSYFLPPPRAALVWRDGLGHFGDGDWRAIADPWAVLKGWLKDHRREHDPRLPPFQGGLAGLFGYGLARTLERLPRPHYDEFAVPDLAVGLYDRVFAYDHLEQAGWRIEALGRIAGAEAFKDPGMRPERRIRQGSREALNLGAALRAAPAFRLQGRPEVFSNFSRDGYLAAVRKAIGYIHAGDCFQVNLSQRLLAPAQEPVSLYARLRERSPSPFGGLFLADDFAVISSSPERFIQMDAEGRIETRPIKGTRPRRSPVEADAAAALELLDSAKDRAENVMIVDLLRNDLGRVCAFGSVKVEAVCEVESYPSVHHLVSVVRGQLRPGLDAIDLLKAAFPGGSVTGAPKVRAMEIINELEPTARGPYCGCLGWLGFDGAMDTNILIRTFTWAKGWLQFPVGGGIVADSDPEEEYEETLAKAAGMLRALEE